MEEIILQFAENIATINEELGLLQIDVEILKFQMAQITWWFRAFVGTIIILIVSQAWQLIWMRKNNKK